MGKKKNYDEDMEFDFGRLLKEMRDMSDDEIELMEQIIQNMTGGEEPNSPDWLNNHFYSYKVPESYAKPGEHLPKWLKPLWKVAYEEEDWRGLCTELVTKAEGRTADKLERDLKKYLCLLIDDFNQSGHMEQNPIRLIGALWLMERFKVYGCFDMVLELLRQDAWFYTAFIDNTPQAIPAILFQLGADQTDKLRDMLYEEGLIPVIKPVVFNTLIWGVLRRPEMRLKIVNILTTYLKHCLKICLKGADSRNVPIYAHALAYAHISEAKPILKRLFTEVDSLDEEIYDEIEEIMDSEDGEHWEDFMCNSVEDYIEHQKEEFLIEYYNKDDWEDEEDREDEDDTDTFRGLFDRSKEQHRYTIRVELLDAPETVSRTLQVPSNIYLDSLMELIMLAFGRKDTPIDYTFTVKDEIYYWDMADKFSLCDLQRKKGKAIRFDYVNHGHVWQHGIWLEKTGDYGPTSQRYINLLDGRGIYPGMTIKDMDDYTQRLASGKMRKPNFKTIQKQICEFEDENEIF